MKLTFKDGYNQALKDYKVIITKYDKGYKKALDGIQNDTLCYQKLNID